MKIPKVEYEVYYNLYDQQLVKLNLSVCENIKIDILLPIKVDYEDIDKLNTSSGYFNDICYTSTSDSGTDISLSDRKNDFIKIIKHYAKKIVILQNIYMIQVKRFDLVILKQIYPQFQILKLIKLNFLIVSLI